MGIREGGEVGTLVFLLECRKKLIFKKYTKKKIKKKLQNEHIRN